MTLERGDDTNQVDSVDSKTISLPVIDRAENCAAIACAIACLESRSGRFIYEYKKHNTAIRRIKAELTKILEEMKQR